MVDCSNVFTYSYLEFAMDSRSGSESGGSEEVRGLQVERDLDLRWRSSTSYECMSLKFYESHHRTK